MRLSNGRNRGKFSGGSPPSSRRNFMGGGRLPGTFDCEGCHTFRWEFVDRRLRQGRRYCYWAVEREIAPLNFAGNIKSGFGHRAWSGPLYVIPKEQEKDGE